MEKFGIALIVVTAFWGLLGIVLPLLIPKGPNQAYKEISNNYLFFKSFPFRLIRMMLIITSACCWLL
jgi:hypothetical protein